MSGTARYDERRARTAADRMALLDQRRQTPAVAATTVPSRTGPGPAPASPAQEWAWLRSQLGPDPRLVVAAAATAPRPVTVDDVSAAAVALADRHEILRTTLGLVEGRLVQLVGERHTMVRSSDAALSTVVDRLAAELGPDGPLWGVELAEAGRVLVVAAHRCVADEYTVGLLLSELARTRSGPAPRYGDVAAWQADLLASPAGRRHLAYWRAALADAPTGLALPVEDLVGGSRQYRSRTTDPEIVLAGYAVVLARYTGRYDLVIGVHEDVRTRPPLAGVAGPITSLLPVRLRLDPDLPFEAVVQQTRQAWREARERGDLPYESIIAAGLPALRFERSIVDFPTFHPHGRTVPLPDGWSVTRPPEGCGAAGTGPELELAADGVLRIRYRNEKVNGLAEALAHLLDATDTHPAVAWSALPLGPVGGGSVAIGVDLAPRDQGRCLHELIEARAAMAPDATAIVAGEDRLSYGELVDRADRVAALLRRNGVGREDLVALAVDRSPAMVVAALAVLKAGAAYLPLDLTQPPKRHATVLAAARPRWLLVDGESPIAPDSVAVVLDMRHARAEEPLPPVAVQPDQLSYVVYTSGSTGSPKGVLGTHRGVVNHLAAIMPAHGVTADDTVLQIPTLAFDASVRDLFGPLSVGAKVVLLSPSEAKDPAAMLARMRRHSVTCLLSVVPTLLRGMAQLADEPAPSVRLLLCSGERLFATDVAAARALFGPDVRMVNQYGPTECTMTTTYLTVPSGPLPDGPLGVGRPVDGALVHVLDRALKPVPFGAVGEIYLGGVGVARGYLGEPGLTAERFLPDPYAGTSGARMYRTGDLGRMRHDGSLVYLGRIDDQVKIRGLRVEPGEVEAVVAAHPAVRQAAVLAVGEPARLVAYVVGPADGNGLGPVREWVRERLPDHLVPASFVVVGVLPRTATGKLDRRALHQAHPIAEPVTEPRDDVERRLAALWRNVLGVNQFGVDDHFAALGGDAAAAVRLVESADGEFSLADLLGHPTVRALATVVKGSA